MVFIDDAPLIRKFIDFATLLRLPREASGGKTCLMRKVIFFLSFIGVALSVQSLSAQAVSPTEPRTDKTPEYSEEMKEFTNLPEQKRFDYIKRVQEANRLFNQKRIFEAFSEIDDARKIFDKNADVFNLMGSCYVEFRDFNKASTFYQKALDLAPKSSIIHFNVAELEFVTRKWKSCLEKMTHVLTLLPKDETVTRRLVEMKILLCHIALGQNDEADQWAKKYDPLLDDSPYYYYAQAALFYREKNLIKAEEYLQMANRVFGNPAIIAPWQDTLIEFGYISSYYGGDSETKQE